ncbi:MAG: hypothetical protein O9331_14390 [Acidovorax sp.]|nr:hypothetical protein [Acidovorax sp.]
MKTTRRSAGDASAQSLQQRLQAHELARHAARLRSIDRMRARLALLDAFMPAINEAGIHLCLDHLTDYCGDSLWISAGLLSDAATARLANVLLANGMKVESRADFPSGGCSLHLKKGRLKVSLTIDSRYTSLLEVPACA